MVVKRLGVVVAGDDGGLYREPVEVLRRERDWLKLRLRQEKAELGELRERAKVVKAELAEMVRVVADDVRETEALLNRYRDAIKAVR